MIAVLLSIFLFITAASCQSCNNFQYAFDWGTEVTAPLDTITFDNLGSSVPWTSQYGTALRITPATSMEVTLTGVNDGANYVNVMPGVTPLSSDWSTNWNKADNYMGYYAWRNVGTITFAQPIRQFSMMLAHDNGCIALGWTPYIAFLNKTGGNIGASPLNAAPAQGSTNQYFILRYRNSCPVVYGIVLAGCAFVMDNLSFKTEPCTPSPCNLTETCFDTGLDAVCCPKNTTWNGVKCITGNPCIDDSPCDQLATCDPLRTGGYTCTCPLKYIGNGAPGNCTLLPSVPSNVTFNIVPILECIDENNVAQFGYMSNETSVLLIDDPLRNNLEPINTAPIVVFLPGRTRRYPLNPGQVLLNVSSAEYMWQLGSNQLNFTNEPALACPIQINIILHFAITGTVDFAQFGQQVRLAFIFATNVDPNRVILVNVTQSASVNKRLVAQSDQTELEVELSVTPPPDNTEKSSADVIRNFVANQQDDLQYDLDQANPNATISTSVVTTKAAPLAPPMSPPSTEAPIAEEPESGPAASPRDFVASRASMLEHVTFGSLLLVFGLGT